MIKKSNLCSYSDFLINSELNYVFGLPGSGKSTLLAAVSECAYLRGIPCFSSYPMRHAYKFQGFDVQYPAGSVFCFDEIYELVGSGTNRGILPTETAMFFKTFRHGRYTVWACSQEADDVARRIRGIVTRSWLIVNPGTSYSVLHPAEIVERLNENGERFILESDKSPLLALFKRRTLYRPDFYDDFDSYCRKEYKEHAKFTSW